jgi:hypothetical protein
MPLVKKCYHCMDIHLTNTRSALESEYDNLLQYLQKNDLGVYSTNKQKADRSTKS